MTTKSEQQEHAEHLRTPAGAPTHRRRFLELMSVGLGGLAAAALGLPVVGFLFAPLLRNPPETWVGVGQVASFKVGETVLVTLPDPSPLPWAGVSSRSAAWLRRAGEDEWIAFSINCTHLGCPIRWLADAQLFLCPCHGGVFYQDGTVAAGPPPRELNQYKVRVANGQVEILTGTLPIGA